MIPFSEFPGHLKRQISYVLTDIDDTLTTEGRLPAVSLAGLERLKGAGIHTIPITGRPAGWCDHIARMWPVDGVVGENGAFYFSYSEKQRRVRRRYFKDADQRSDDRRKMDQLRDKILASVPGCQIASDQAYREADLAIDFCEDVAPLSQDAIQRIVSCFEDAGARAKVSSIHVNGWFGEYDKLTMTSLFFEDIFGERLDDAKERSIFIGDSPNDAPMFEYFPHSVGVANVLRFKENMAAVPSWVTRQEAGSGFAEMVDLLLS